MAVIYRVGHKRHDLTDPSGSERTTGRWHGPGQRVLYFSSSLALCILELKVNEISFRDLRRDYHFLRAEVDLSGKSCERTPSHLYKSGWAHARRPTQEFGSVWFSETRSLFLEVRSAVLPESNYVVNAAHPDFARMRFSKAEPLPLDSRLVD